MSFKKYKYLFIISLFFIIISYNFIDIPLAKWTFTFSEFTHNLFYDISYFGESSTYIILSLFGWILLRKKNPLSSIKFRFVFLSIIFSGIIVNILKFLFGRMRPWSLESSDQFGFLFFQVGTPLTSFPSGHTTTAFAIAMALVYLFPKQTYLWIGFGVLMAISRIGVSAHYLSDTIAGMLTGVGSVIILHYYLKSKKLI